MASTTLNIEVQAQVDQAVRGLTNLKTTFNDFHAANQDAAGALGVFGVSLTALDNPITAVAGVIKDSIDTTLNWGESIQKLAAASGESAQKASVMATVFGDFGVNVDSLDKTVKAFTKNGLQFNLDTMKSLAKQYQSITDPVARDKFAFDNFGKSALDMNEILSASPEKLQSIADAAQTSGKILDGPAVQSMEDFRIKTAELNDKIDGLKIAIGGPLISTLSNAVDGFNNLTKTIAIIDVFVEQHTGLISQDEAVTRANAIAQGDFLAALRGVQPVIEAQAPVIEHIKDDTADLAVNTNASATAYEMQIPQMQLSATQMGLLSAAVDANNAKVTSANALLAIQIGMQGELTAAEVFQTASTHLDAEGQAELATKLGLMNNATYTAITAVIANNTALDAHVISADQAIKSDVAIAAQAGLVAGAVKPSTQAILDLNSAIDAMHDKTINIDVITHNYLDNTYGSGGPGYEPPVKPPGKASGGPVFAGMPYTIGESGPETFVPSQNGTIVPNGAGAGMTINVDARNSVDPNAVYQAGYAGARRALVEAGYRADQISRMGVS